MAKKMSVAEVRTEYKRKLRKAFKEYPVLYYKYKEYLKREHNDWFSAAIILFDKYEEMKDPVAWMKRQEEYAEHEKHSKQIQADHAARETQAELREWQLSRRDGAVQCPYCKSWDTDPISTASRVASVALVGISYHWHYAYPNHKYHRL